MPTSERFRYSLPERGVFGTRLSVLLNLGLLTIQMRLLIIIAIIAIAFATISVISLTFVFDNAVKSHQEGDPACPHDKELRTYQQWVQTVKFPYAAPKERLRRVKNNYDQVEVGSSKKDVIEAFGLPDFEQEDIPMEPWRPCTGYEFFYYFEKPDGVIDNEIKDKRVQVFFTIDGKVHWIVGNVGLADKGGYAVRP